MRTCTRCGETKSLDDFQKEARGKYGRRPECRECSKAYKKFTYQNTKLGISLKWQQERRLASSNYDKYGKLVERKCRSCKEVKSASAFYNDKKYDCKPCEVLYNRFARYHMTKDQYDMLREKQNFSCKICGDLEQSEFSLVMDHDHNCCSERGRSCGKCIRGLLCPNCNVAVGMIKDNLAVAVSLVDYLQSYNVIAETEHIEVSALSFISKQ